MSLRDLEKELIAEKPWALKGEVKGKDRERDSLLNEMTIEFPVSQVRSGLPEIIDEDTGELGSNKIDEDIQAMVKVRIAKQLFDDPAPRKNVEDEASGAVLEEVLEGADVSKVTASLMDAYKSDFHVTETGASVNIDELEHEVLESWAKLDRKLGMYSSGY